MKNCKLDEVDWIITSPHGGSILKTFHIPKLGKLMISNDLIRLGGERIIASGFKHVNGKVWSVGPNFDVTRCEGIDINGAIELIQISGEYWTEGYY